jgi:hypothetical protein
MLLNIFTFCLPRRYDLVIAVFNFGLPKRLQFRMLISLFALRTYGCCTSLLDASLCALQLMDCAFCSLWGTCLVHLMMQQRKIGGMTLHP